MLANS